MDNLEELSNYFKSLPRPLPKNLNVCPGEFVINADAFLDSHFSMIRGLPPNLAQVFYDRLLQWKETYEKHIAAKR